MQSVGLERGIANDFFYFNPFIDRCYFTAARPMKFIFFDLGSTSGWAHNCGDKIEHGQLDFTSAKSRPERMLKSWQGFEAAISGTVQSVPDEKIDAVVFERPFARGQAATRSLWGQAAILEAVATSWGLPCLDVTPLELKKFATCNGHASKEEMTVAARRFLHPKVYGLGSLGEHEADAICGLFYSIKHVSKLIPKPAKRKKKS